MINKKHIDAKGNPVISIGVILSTFKSFIDISDTKYKVDFTDRTTIKNLLGFNSKILNSGYNISDSTVQIATASSILIHCDIISGSFHNGIRSSVLYSFPSYLVPVGYKINIIPPNMFYLPVSRNVINNISFRITDEDDKVLDFKEEEMALAIHLKQI